MITSFVSFPGLATADEKENVNLGLKKLENKLEIQGNSHYLSFALVLNVECG